MPIDLTGLPDKKVETDENGIDLTGLPDKNSDRLREAYRSDTTSSAKEAQVFDIASRTELPAQSVRSDLVKAQRVANEPDWEGIERDTPNLAKKLAANPDLFRVAKDDLPEMSTLGRSLSAGGAAITQGTLGIAEGMFRAPEALSRMSQAVPSSLPQSTPDGGPVSTLMSINEAVRQILTFSLLSKDAGVEVSTELADKIADAGDMLSEDSQMFPEAFSRLGIKGQKADEALADAIEGDLTGIGDVLTDPEAVSGFIGQAIPSLVLAIASGGSLSLIAFLEGTATASDIAAFEQATGQRITEGEYLQAVAQAATINTALEKIGLDRILAKSGPGVASKITKALGAALAEGGTEGLQEFNSNLAEKLAFNPDAELGEGVLGSVIGGAGAGVGTSTVNLITQKAAVEEATEKDAAAERADGIRRVADDLLTQARESQLRKKSPLVYEEMVEGLAEATGTENVFIDVENLVDFYAQQGMTIDTALQELPDVKEQVETKLAEGGGDVVIPIQKIATRLVDRPEDAGLRDHMRFDAESMSKFEAESFKQEQVDELADEASRIIQGNENDEAFIASVQTVENAAFEQLESAKRFTSDVNQTYASTVGNFYTVLAERLGQTPEQVAEQYPLNIRSVIEKGPVVSFRQGKTKGAFTPSDSTITLLGDADLSTFVHEFGHFQLEVLADLASKENTPDEVKQDMQTMLDWFGVEDVATWNNFSLEQKREHHEKFARGFEKYLFEGKAPNSELSSVFARIREWLVRVYKSAKALNVTLTDEVTQVFDRLVASEQQIREAEAVQGYREVFKTEAESGMTPAQWAKYQAEADKPTEDATRDIQARSLRDMQWLRNARTKELKRLQKEAKAKRKEARETAEAEVMAEPVQQAIHYLKTGKIGDEVQVQKGHRLSNAALQEMYPEESLGNRDWESLPKGRGGVRGKEGVHPDIMGPVFGFKTGDDLVAAILEAENAKDKIEARTDQIMLERHGEVSTPEALDKAVDRAIHNEARTKFIATELVALERATGKKRLLLRAAKQYAKDVIDNMEIRKLKNTNRFSVAERKAARNAEKELRRGNREKAARHKRSQIISNLLYRNALNANDEVGKMLRLFNRMSKPGTRKNLSQDYLDQIDQLLERYDLRASVSQKEIDRRTSLSAWVSSQQDSGIDPAIDERLLNEARRTHYSRMSLGEMRGLYDSVRSIEHIARLKQKLLTAKDEREFRERVDGAVSSIEEKATKTVEVEMETNAPLHAIKQGKREFFAMHRKLSSIVRTMDGLNDGGPVWELLLRPANERADFETVEHEKATERLSEILKPIYSQGRMNKQIDIPGTDKRISIEGRFLMLLNMGNEVNFERMLTGELSNGWSEADFDAVKNSASKQEWDAAQGVWNFINEYWSDIAAKQARITGVAPEKVEATPVETPHGTYSGGYFPIVTNPKRSQRSDANSENELLVQKLQGNYSNATTRRGHTKARGKSGTGPLRYDMGVITGHIDQVVHDLAWHEWAIDANRIIRDPSFDQAVRKHYGPEVARLIKQTVEDVVIGDVGAKNGFDRVMNHLRVGSTVVGLGWSVFTAALQPLGLSQSVARIGAAPVAKGMGRWLSSGKNMEDSMGWVYENSEFMRLRGKTMMREMNEVLDKVAGKKTTNLTASFFYFIAKLQTVADMPTWVGQYHKSIDGGADHDTAVQLANQAVKDSQGSGLLMDRSEIQRGGPLQKLFTNFYSYFNATYQLLADRKSQTDFRKVDDVGRLAVDVMLLTAVPATLAAILREVIYGLSGGGDDEERSPEEIAMWLAKENLSYLSGLMVGTREMSGAIQGFYGYSGPAGTRFFGESAKLIKQVGQGEIDTAAVKAANQVGGILFHYPAAQVERTAEGVAELAEGETINPLVLLTGTE